ncbi:cutinase family protein [Cryptosporangium aurantiacum]|uniref:Cutinase n=1 Tax=Cryptosporangium aurantiacum TaxID=134849 RepID=A0A1M7QCJ2_9ACTN|nr:cutinase [Cryptosporangium aurantiacum]
MSLSLAVRRVVTAAAVVATSVTGLAMTASPATAACADVEVVFARGSTELPGLGIVGTPLVRAIQQNLPGKTVTSYAVNYAANVSQTSAGPGATDMSNHVKQVAAQCANTVFVLGGYSQGASVTDIAIGIRTFLGTGGTIPTNLAPRIKAITVFGNPLRLYGQNINTASPLYGSRARDVCATGDPVCGGGFNALAHLSYPTNGSVTSAAQFAANLVKAG